MTEKTKPSAAPKRETKSDQVIVLLKRKNGATLKDLVAATGWPPHTARAAMTGLKTKGRTIERTKVGGASRYAIVASA
jgi:hypothetical protein